MVNKEKVQWCFDMAVYFGTYAIIVATGGALLFGGVAYWLGYSR